MNWLPRASAWQEMEAARAKRKANNESFLANSSAVNANLIAVNNSTTDTVNLTIQQAVTRIRTKSTKKV